MAEATQTREEEQAVRVLLASARDWFASALQAVLEPEGFHFNHVTTDHDALGRIADSHPDVVIIDEGVSDLSAPELCRQVLAMGLRSSVPILVYSPNYWHEAEQAEAMQAGAWDVIREPIRSRLLVAKLRRLLHLKRLIESAGESPLVDPDTGLYRISGLIHSLPIVGSLAERSGAPLSCSVVGPTHVADSSEELNRQRRATAALLKRHTRASDLCAAVGGADIALIAYDTNADTATAIVRRLGEIASEREERYQGVDPLSGGIADLPISAIATLTPVREDVTPAVEGRAPDRLVSLSRLAAAQRALLQARDAGGGILIAEHAESR